jgi:hypothetical protein
MPATLEELERRVMALERAQSENTTSLRWIAGTLGQVQSVVEEVRSDLKTLRGEVPALVATAVGEAMRAGD